MRCVLRRHAGKDDVGQIIVVDVGVNIIRNAVIIPHRRCDAVGWVAAIVGHEQNGNRRNSPGVVGIIKITFKLGSTVAANFRQCNYFCINSLFGSKIFDLLRKRQPCGIVWRHDQIFTAAGYGSAFLVGSFGIINFRKGFVVKKRLT